MMRERRIASGRSDTGFARVAGRRTRGIYFFSEAAGAAGAGAEGATAAAGALAGVLPLSEEEDFASDAAVEESPEFAAAGFAEE